MITFALLPACASVTIRGPAMIVEGEGGIQHVESAVVYKASGIDRLPMQDVEITRDRVSIIEHMPENGSWPSKRTTHYLKDGTEVVDETPLYASDASNTTNAIHNLWSGVVKNLAGLAASAWTAIALGGQATAAQINSSNNATKTANVSTLSNASVQKAKISADVTKTLGR